MQQPKTSTLNAIEFEMLDETGDDGDALSLGSSGGSLDDDDVTRAAAAARLAAIGRDRLRRSPTAAFQKERRNFGR